jgi:uncharacterized protein (UPF0276 family)
VTELADLQHAIVRVLTDTSELKAWLADPAAYATRALGRTRAAEMLGGLDPYGVCVAGEMGSHHLEGPLERMHPGAATPAASALAPTRPATPGARAPLVGVGYRPELMGALWRSLHDIEVWEHTVDRSLRGWPAGRNELARFADVGPVTLHSVNLSVGSAECRNDPARVDAIGELCRVTGVDHLSDHLSYMRTAGGHVNDFVPLWRTEEQLELLVDNVEWLQSRIGVQMAFENASVFFDPGGDLSWAEMSNELVRRTGCGLLLDITNLLHDEANGLRSAQESLHELDLDAVVAVHLSGGVDTQGVHIDSHDHPVRSRDLELLAELLPRLTGCRSIIIERDDRYDDGLEVVADLKAVREVVAPATILPGR